MPWLGLTYVVLVLQMLLSMLTQFQRKDMITMTVCTLGFYFLFSPEYVRRRHFRGLVGLAIFSLAQDAAWFVMNRGIDNDEEDGGVERGIEGFSRKMSYLSFACRVSTIADLIVKSIVHFLITSFYLFLGPADNYTLERLLGLHQNC